MGNKRRYIPKEIDKFAKLLGTSRDNVLVLQYGSWIVPRDPKIAERNIKILSQALDAMQRPTLILVVEDMNEISTVDEEGMRSYGWQRIPADEEKAE